MRVSYGRRATGLLYRLLRGETRSFSPEEISVIWRSTGPLTIWLVAVPSFVSDRRVYTGRGLASSRSSAYRTIHERAAERAGVQIVGRGHKSGGTGQVR